MKTLALLALSSVLAFAQAPAKDKKPAAPAAKVAPAKPAEAAKPAKAAEPAKAAPAAKTTPAAGEIVANKDSKTFHKADCKLAAKMKAENKVTFKTAADATKEGYKACKVCSK